MSRILKLLEEIPLSAVLRERVALFDDELERCRARVAALESENKKLQTQNKKLQTQNINLKNKINQKESSKKVLYDICPYCNQPEGKVVDIQPHLLLGHTHGVKVFYYECNNCHKKYDREKENY